MITSRKSRHIAFPFPSLLIVQQSKLHCQQTAKPSNLIYNNGIKTISVASACSILLSSRGCSEAEGRWKLWQPPQLSAACYWCAGGVGEDDDCTKAWEILLLAATHRSDKHQPSLSLVSLLALPITLDLQRDRPKGDGHPPLVFVTCLHKQNNFYSFKAVFTLALSSSLLSLFDVYLCWWREKSATAEAEAWLSLLPPKTDFIEPQGQSHVIWIPIFLPPTLSLSPFFPSLPSLSLFLSLWG